MLARILPVAALMMCLGSQAALGDDDTTTDTAGPVTADEDKSESTDAPKSPYPEIRVTQEELSQIRPKDGELQYSADIDLVSQYPKTAAFQFSGMGMFGASAADLATTEWGLSQPNLQEGNPIAGNRGVRVVHHVLGPAAVYWTTEKLRQSGRPKLALALRIGLMAAYSFAAVHNVRQVHAQPGLP